MRGDFFPAQIVSDSLFKDMTSIRKLAYWSFLKKIEISSHLYLVFDKPPELVSKTCNVQLPIVGISWALRISPISSLAIG